MSGWTDLDEYRITRHAGELDRDKRTLGYAADEEMDKDKGGRQPITYRQWLKSRAGAKPSPEDEAALKAAEYERAVLAHFAAEELREAYEKACTERALVFAELVAGSWSQAELAQRLGVSRAAVHNVVKRAQASDVGGVW